jgi:phospholipid:diacylglycerol acyltransferase
MNIVTSLLCLLTLTSSIQGFNLNWKQVFKKDEFKHAPVAIIPGYFTTKLKSHSTAPCLKSLNNKLFWIAPSALIKIGLNPNCVYDALHVGYGHKDPAGFKLRAQEGVGSLGLIKFPIWDTVIQSLKATGEYTDDKILLAGYDWRIPLPQMEVRDGYFSKLKANIEELYTKNNNTRVALIGHSMGSNVAFYFLQWVTRTPKMGSGQWVSKYLHTFVNIAGPLLGAPKAMAAALLGGTSEIASFGEFFDKSAGQYWLGTARNRSRLFQSWGSIATLMPMGGNRIWGNTREPLRKKDQELPADHQVQPKYWELNRPKHMRYMRLSQKPLLTLDHGYANGSDVKLSPEDAFKWFLQISRPNDTNLGKAMSEQYTYSADRYPSPQPKRSEWFNPLLSPLPKVAKDSTFSINCLYGVGIQTETAYSLRNSNASHHIEAGWAFNLNKNRTPHIAQGVEYTDGDVTVPLMSLGYMCRKGWKAHTHNPSQIPGTAFLFVFRCCRIFF